MTRERIRAYPALLFVGVVATALFNWIGGDGLIDASGAPLGGDFLSFYTAGAMTDAGQALSLLDPDEQHGYQEQLLSRANSPLSQWVSPPFLAWLFVPLSRLPYVWAYALFVLMGGALLTTSLALLRRQWPTLPAAITLAWFALQYYPTLQWLLNGQTTMLWMLLFTLVTIQLRRGNDFSAGLFLGCFACKPPLVIGLAAALLGARRWRTLSGAALSASAWLAVGYMTLPDAMAAYVAHAGDLVSVVRDPGYRQVGLHGSFELPLLLFGSWWPTGASVAGTALCIAFLATLAALWVRVPWRPGTEDWDRRFAATLALGLIASPHLYGYDLALLVLPFAIIWAQYPQSRRAERPLDGGPFLALTAAVWALGLVGPVLSVGQVRLSEHWFGVPIALQLGLPAIAVWAYWMLRPIDHLAHPSALRTR